MDRFGFDTKPVHPVEQLAKLAMMMNRENALAASWAAAYSVSLVLVLGLCDYLETAPYYSVPFVVVVLPFVVALILLPFRSPRPGARP